MLQSDQHFSTSGIEPPVIARIPDLDVPSSPRKHRHSSRSKTRTRDNPSGRMFDAGWSMKVLVGLGLCLMVASVATYVPIKMSNTQSNTDNIPDQAWQPPPPAPSADLTPSYNSSLAQAEPSLDKLANTANAIEVEAKADFSPWPHPAHPIATQADTSQSEILTADRRNSVISGGGVRTNSVQPLGAGGAAPSNSENRGAAAHFEGTIDTSSDRNFYDRSRSSIH
jgi:hypothetical protein